MLNATLPPTQVLNETLLPNETQKIPNIVLRNVTVSLENSTIANGTSNTNNTARFQSKFSSIRQNPVASVKTPQNTSFQMEIEEFASDINT